MLYSSREIAYQKVERLWLKFSTLATVHKAICSRMRASVTRATIGSSDRLYAGNGSWEMGTSIATEIRCHHKFLSFFFEFHSTCVQYSCFSICFSGKAPLKKSLIVRGMLLIHISQLNVRFSAFTNCCHKWSQFSACGSKKQRFLGLSRGTTYG